MLTLRLRGLGGTRGSSLKRRAISSIVEQSSANQVKARSTQGATAGAFDYDGPSGRDRAE